MLNWIKLWWKVFQAKRNLPKFELERAFLESEVMGCRDSAETLVLNCRQIWERFGWWSYEASTAVVKLNNTMYAVLGDQDRAAMVALGAVSYALKVGQDPKDFLPRTNGTLAMLAARGLDQKITYGAKVTLVELFPSILREPQMRDAGTPTAEQVLIWIARGDDFRGWGCTSP